MKKALLASMAIIALAGTVLADITYPVDVTKKFSLVDSSTGNILHWARTWWPNTDGSKPVGLSTNLVFFEYVETIAPQYDSRIYTLRSHRALSTADYTCRDVYAVVRRPLDEIKVAAQNREMEEVQRHSINLQREVLETRLLMTALIQHTIDQQALPPKVQLIVQNYKANGVKLWKNRDRVNALLAKIEAGEDFDLDAGWEPAK